MSVMYRYIDADKMIAKIKPVQAEDETSCVLLGDVRRILKDFVNQAPIADVVEVVRCKDCLFGEVDTEGSGYVQCLNRDTPWRKYKEEFAMHPYDFCSYGAKMKGGGDT